MLATRTLAAAFAALLVSTSISAQGGPDVEARVLTMEGAGINPICLMGDRPMIGTLWRSGIDGTVVPAAQNALLVVSFADLPTGFVTNFGEVLIDPYQRFVTLTRSIHNGKAQFGIPVPDDITLLGETFYAQALVIGPRFQTFCNGLELILGSSKPRIE